MLPGKNVPRSKRTDKERGDKKDIETLPVYVTNKYIKFWKTKIRQIIVRDMAQTEKKAGVVSTLVLVELGGHTEEDPVGPLDLAGSTRRGRRSGHHCPPTDV